VTLTNTVADFIAIYTPPEVTVDTDFDYQVTITDATSQTAVAITTNFRTHIKPRASEQFAIGTKLSVLFNPVILSLTANGSETPGNVELLAAVSDDSAPAQLSFQWSFTPNTDTPDATFANNGQDNPTVFQGYTVDHQGTITLAVTDEHNGTTTLHYQLLRDQFPNPIDHTPVNGLKRIVAGNAHTCVLTGQNRVRCWGDNQFGQLGYGNAIDVGDAPTRLPFTAGDVPLPFDPMTNLPTDPVVQLVAGNNHTCVLQASGLIYCWGDNQFGQLGYNRTDNLGDGEPVTSFGYVTVGGPATRIAAGGDHTCAILKGGALRCWGRNDFGQLGHGNTENIGDNETVDSAGNVDLGPGVTVKDLALGGFHTCALLTTGAVRCWGRNDFGQLGYGNTEALGDNEPINNLPDVSLTGTVQKLVAGDLHTCALTVAGTLRCWGLGQDGELGQDFPGFFVFDNSWGNQANEFPSTLPSDIDTGAPVTDVAAGGGHTCALSSDGQLKCWGFGGNGELGYGDFSDRFTPPANGVNLDGVSAFAITAGEAHTCALRSNSTARCWGQGADGRLGLGSTDLRPTATGNVDIQIFAPRFTIGGSVRGLGTSQSVVLQNNGGSELTVSSNGGFTFTTQAASNSSYAVTVLTNPPGSTCAVSNGSGTVMASAITDVVVTCGTSTLSVDYLIVAGGGGGGGLVGGGGGGGGVISGSETIVSGTYSVTVGSGGAGGSAIQGNGGPGDNSLFNGHTAIGGGGGAAVDSNLDAGAGGSGGGGSYRNVNSASGIGQAGAGVSGQGHAGGNTTRDSGQAGGGGGFSGTGGSGSPTRSGDGGQGRTNSISGSAQVYGAGGGGGAQSGFTSAGGNGGTNAGNGDFGDGAAAAANLGGGGGGGGFENTGGHPGGAGGSGVVIIRYPGLPIASGGTITQSGGSTIHTFTSTATFVVP